MAGENVMIKKVKPYPFAVQFSKEGQVFAGQVLKLVMHGFMADVGAVVAKVGDIYQVQFTLPGSHSLTVAAMKVIKTYDRYQGGEVQKAAHLVEFHFVNPTDDLRARIKTFLKQIRQTGTDLV
jgi:hypothetical protein